MNNHNRSILSTKSKWIRGIRALPFWLTLLATLLLIFDFGFDQSLQIEEYLETVYAIALIAAIISMLSRYLYPKWRPPAKVWFIDLVLMLFLLAIVGDFYMGVEIGILDVSEWFVITILLALTREFSALRISFRMEYFNPAQLFILSFVMIVIIGTGFLMLPKATYDGISLFDALFTSTSAVCVTGLIVVDTGSYFTPFGQTMIIALIQMGGLGIMTFTSYFSYFFTGGSSYENQLLLRDMTNSERIADVFNTLKRILLVTFAIELTGAVCIYFSLDPSTLVSVSDKIFFSIFHSISAFCNAGFSTLANSLYETEYRFNYPLHISLALLFTLGGIGFPIIFNLSQYLKHIIINRIWFFNSKRRIIYIPWVININTRIVVITSAILITVGTVMFYFIEYNNTLAEHNAWGKVVTAFFLATTPRTAGFNTVDMSALQFSTVMFIFLLMWIGASPGSTGGGIKTSTIAIATLNYFSLAKGKNRVELFRREVAEISIRRAFALISLSLVVIGFGIFLISAFDPNTDLLSIAFECFSAYSTVGLSLGITASLSTASKFVLIATMFVGRVSMLTLLIAVLRKVKYQNYSYPTEEILIN
ncbi:ATPase [Reichenbachiella agarivorans]|uniref:ATPase n=1 Tax=Reichenbachiella agarivorans TaxID=2979464 RepID=A0ABY6CLZ0_9BACT|nr:potassium transporter TrkG [Reichenbachiella agarivorans]UXP31526.1 ATPase [Reichenbachiella agarivorans]